MLCPQTFNLSRKLRQCLFGRVHHFFRQEGVSHATDKVLKSKALHIYDSTNSGVVSMEPWVLMGRGRCPQFPSTVDGVGAMTFDCHVGTCPQKGTRAGSNAVLPH